LQNLGFHEHTFIVNPLDKPRMWHVGNLPDLALEQLAQRIKSKLTSAAPEYSLYNSLNLMLNYISTPIEKNIKETFDKLKQIDQRRNLDSSKIFTELYKLREEN